jgi:hypothetical protein
MELDVESGRGSGEEGAEVGRGARIGELGEEEAVGNFGDCAPLPPPRGSGEGESERVGAPTPTPAPEQSVGGAVSVDTTGILVSIGCLLRQFGEFRRLLER